MKKLIILMLTDRKKLSAAVGIMVIIVMLINCFAVAENRYDTKWYYQTQFNEVAEIALAPSIESLKAPQRFAQQEDVVVDIDIIEVGWIENSKFLLSALINCCEPDRVELHPESFLDLDGGYIGPNSDAVPGNGEHTEHYLWTSDGYGPVKEQVDDPSKQLILFDVKGIMINGMECLCESDFIRLDDGRLFLYAECDLAWVSNVNAVGDAKQAQERLAADPDTAIATLLYTTIIYEEGNDASLYAKHASLTSYEYEFSTDPVELAFMNTGRGTMFNLDIKWPIETLRQYYHLSCGVNSDIVDVLLGTEGDDGLIYPSGASWSIGGVKYQYLHYSSIGIYDYHLDNTTFLSPACANSSIIKIPDIFLACIDSYLSGILIYSEDHVILPEYEIGSRYDFPPIYGLITYTDTQNKTIHKTLRIDCFVRSCYLTEPAGSRYNVTIQLVPSIHDAEDFLFNNQQYIWYTTI